MGVDFGGVWLFSFCVCVVCSGCGGVLVVVGVCVVFVVL